MFEEYMNEIHTNAGAPTHVPTYSNKRVSGLATYRCADTATSGEGGTHQCYISARVRGFNWDHVASTPPVVTGTGSAGGNIVLSTYHPTVYDFGTAGHRITAEEQEMTDYCTIRDIDIAGTATPAGYTDQMAQNRFAAGALTTTLATYRY